MQPRLYPTSKLHCYVETGVWITCLRTQILELIYVVVHRPSALVVCLRLEFVKGVARLVGQAEGVLEEMTE